MPDKLICKDSFQGYADKEKAEVQQVTDLIKRVVKDSLTELIHSSPSQQDTTSGRPTSWPEEPVGQL